MTLFNPHSIVAQYGLDLVCGLAYRSGPVSIRIRCGDGAIARAVARRFAGCPVELRVDDEGIAAAIMRDYHLAAAVSDATPETEADVEIIPFPRAGYALPQTPDAPAAARVVMITENSFSYRSLMRPGSVTDSARRRRRFLGQTHALTGMWGLLDPLYMTRTAIAHIVGHRASSLHFRVGQQAADSIYVSGWRAWLSYVVVLTGERRA